MQKYSQAWEAVNVWKSRILALQRSLMKTVARPGSYVAMWHSKRHEDCNYRHQDDFLNPVPALQADMK